jgi:hypothetical protein
MQRQPLPPLYESGVVYKDEPRDVWRHAVDVLGEKWGDCEDLAAYRAAELRVSGEDPDAAVTVYQSGPGRYHAVVARSGGVLEDPSRALGMMNKDHGMGHTASVRGTLRGATRRSPWSRRASANVVGADPDPSNGAITFEVIKVPGGWGQRAGWRGYVRIPFGLPGADGTPQALLTVGPQKGSQSDALKSAATSAATALLQNPQVHAALAQIPGGEAVADVLSSPDARKAVTAIAKKLKFW